MDRVWKDKGKKHEPESGFLGKVKGFIHDVGEKIEEAVGVGFEKPIADVTGVDIESINLKKADLVVDVLVKNPNPVPIPLMDINYLIESDGRKLVSGLIPDAGTIRARGEETVKIPVTLIYDDIKSTGHKSAKIDKNGIGYVNVPITFRPKDFGSALWDIRYAIKGNIDVDTPFGAMKLPISKEGGTTQIKKGNGNDNKD